MAIWEQFAVPYFFAVNFALKYIMGGRGKIFSRLLAMSPMVGWLVVHYPYQRKAGGEKLNLFWERYMSCTGGQMCYFYRVKMNLSHKNSRIMENFI